MSNNHVKYEGDPRQLLPVFGSCEDIVFTNEREAVKGGLWKLEQRIDLKHGCVRAAYSVEGGECQSDQRAVAGNQTGNQAGVVELGTNIDDAIGFEPESVWPVIAMLWDMHGYKGVYDLGVIGVWMSGLEQMLYVSGIGDMSDMSDVGAAQ